MACEPIPAASEVPQNLAWSEEFNGASVNEGTWNFETGVGNPAGWGNNELEFYRKENAQVADDPAEPGTRALVITARRESYGGRSYTSSRMTTSGKASFTYGRIEARMKLPEGQGIWPAFWMLGQNIGSVGWPACGETDIMEMVGGTQNGKSNFRTYGTLHWGPDWQHHSSTEGNHSYQLPTKLSSGYRTYTLDWTPQEMIWSVDGREYFRQSITPAAMVAFHRPQFLLLNLAVGGNWPGDPDGTTVFPQQFWIDWIRVYQNQ